MYRVRFDDRQSFDITQEDYDRLVNLMNTKEHWFTFLTAVGDGTTRGVTINLDVVKAIFVDNPPVGTPQ